MNIEIFMFNIIIKCANNYKLGNSKIIYFFNDFEQP